LLAHCRTVAGIIPLFGFYLQPAVGGRVLSYAFWRRFCEIEAVAAIKVAPFNRYQTLDVVRAVAESGRAGEIALYTAMTTTSSPTSSPDSAAAFLANGPSDPRAVELLALIHGGGVLEALPSHRLTDANAALFDAPNHFAGCIAGCTKFCAARACSLAAGVSIRRGPLARPLEEIDRVCRAYPHLADDQFVSENLARWLRPKLKPPNYTTKGPKLSVMAEARATPSWTPAGASRSPVATIPACSSTRAWPSLVCSASSPSPFCCASSHLRSMTSCRSIGAPGWSAPPTCSRSRASVRKG